MKYAYLYAVLLILVIAMGCGKGEDTVTPTQTTSSGSTAATTSSQTTTQTASTQNYDLSSEERAKALVFEATSKVTVSTPFKIMQVGDSYVFGLGIKNVMPKETKFKLDVHFKEAKTSGGLATLMEEADDDTMLTWLAKNKFSTITVPGNGEIVVPIIVEVKSQIGPGEGTMPGSYAFDVIVNYESSSQFWDPYEEKLLTIKVKE